MKSLKKRSQGFTIIELLIVIVVIGILTLLVISTYSSIQEKARNSQRQKNVQDLQAQIESFDSQNGYYPSLSDMNNAAFRASKFKNFDSSDLVDPSSKCSPMKASCLTASPKAKAYSYTAYESDGTTVCTAGDTSCAQYTLTATYEGNVNGSSTYVKTNLD